MLGLIVCLLAVFFYFSYKRRWVSFVLVVFLVTAGFQLVPLSLFTFPGVNKSYDWAFFYSVVVFLSNPSRFVANIPFKFIPLLREWLMLIFLLFFYNILILQVDFGSNLSVLRVFLFIVIFTPFLSLEGFEYQKAFRTIIFFTAFASLVYIFQNVIGVSLLNNISNDASNVGVITSASVLRFFNVPVLAFPCLLMLFFFKELGFSVFSKRIVIILIILALLAAQHRNIIFMLIVSLALGYVVRKRVKPAYIVLALICVFCILFGAASLLGGRFSTAVTDIESLFSRDFSRNAQFYLSVQESSTTEYRIFHFLERFRYVISDFKRSVFGVGFITESSEISKHLPFSIGLSDEHGNVTQVDTADIYWSLIVIRTGISGLILKVSLVILSAIYYFKRRSNPAGLVMFLLFLQLLITSIFSIELMMAHTYAIMFLLLGYYKVRAQLI